MKTATDGLVRNTSASAKNLTGTYSKFNMPVYR
jgi:hypothetical protein